MIRLARRAPFPTPLFFGRSTSKSWSVIIKNFFGNGCFLELDYKKILQAIFYATLKNCAIWFIVVLNLFADNSKTENYGVRKIHSKIENAELRKKLPTKKEKLQK